jgi:hypothetical protein
VCRQYGNFRKCAGNMGILGSVQTIWEFMKVCRQYGNLWKFAGNIGILGSMQTIRNFRKRADSGKWEC